MNTQVIEMILRGILQLRESELHWLCKRDGVTLLYPDAFQRYFNGSPAYLRASNDVMSICHRIVSRGDNLEESRSATKAWALWKHTLLSLPRGEARPWMGPKLVVNIQKNRTWSYRDWIATTSPTIGSSKRMVPAGNEQMEKLNIQDSYCRRPVGHVLSKQKRI